MARDEEAAQQLHQQQQQEDENPHRRPAPLTEDESTWRDDTGRRSLAVANAPPSSSNFRSLGLPLKISDAQKKQIPPPRLLHPILRKVPMQIRFGLNGFLCNILFMVAYNFAVENFEKVDSSTIYSVVYLIFIPIGHAFISLLVFGWPERYFASLLSNFPIGLTAIALGAALTAYLDKVRFNQQVVELIRQNWTLLGYPPEATVEDDIGEFYSSLLVLFVTGIWTFVLSVFINSPNETTDKKEL